MSFIKTYIRFTFKSDSRYFCIDYLSVKWYQLILSLSVFNFNDCISQRRQVFQSQPIKPTCVMVSASFFSGGGSNLAQKSIPFTSNSPSHSYLQATSAEPRSLIKAECCPDLSPFPLKCSVLCSMRKSFAAWFNEPSVEPADLMTCENINLLPPRVLLLGKQSIIHPRFYSNLFYSPASVLNPFVTCKL